MFIAIVGTPSSGKRTVLEYLKSQHGFQEITLTTTPSENVPEKALGDLSISSSSSSPPEPSTPQTTFGEVSTLLDHVTRNWRSNLVTTDLRSYDQIQGFVKRPFFLLLSVDGPLRVRFQREKARRDTLSLEDFVDEHDLLLNGPRRAAGNAQTDYRKVQELATLHVCNDYETRSALYDCLDGMDLLNEERLRPGWDTYFMTLASLASHRSNCMKRRVGALLVRSKRILSTGYNGTAKGTRNCNQGGCARCNGSARGGEALNECLCLHAEENALLEAGKERIGEDSVIYCNTCPCLRCSVKIVQCGVREVVYNQSYSMDEASARILKEGGVVLRQLHLPTDVQASLL